MDVSSVISARIYEQTRGPLQLHSLVQDLLWVGQALDLDGSRSADLSYMILDQQSYSYSFEIVLISRFKHFWEFF